MHAAIKVLDHGYIRLVEAYGHGDAGEHLTADPNDCDMECGIIEAARQSTQGNFRGWEEGDAKLLAYLFNGKPQHATPFEFAGMIIEVQDPTCVVWEWVRHRTHSLEDGVFTGEMGYNVMSSRYGEIPAVDYIPTVERCLINGGANKQAGTVKGAEVLDTSSAEAWLSELKELYDQAQNVYKNGLRAGIPKEIARLSLTFGRYWRMRVKADLRNWIAFMTLRSDPNAQWEIRAYAEAVGTILQEQFPRTYALFDAKRKEK